MHTCMQGHSPARLSAAPSECSPPQKPTALQQLLPVVAESCYDFKIHICVHAPSMILMAVARATPQLLLLLLLCVRRQWAAQLCFNNPRTSAPCPRPALTSGQPTVVGKSETAATRTACTMSLYCMQRAMHAFQFKSKLCPCSPHTPH